MHPYMQINHMFLILSSMWLILALMRVDVNCGVSKLVA